MKTDPKTPSPAYTVTPLNNFDWYEGAGVPTPCRDAEHALSVAKGILERSLAHEHAQSKDPTDPEELIERWDDFGDYPSINPPLNPPFDPSTYARQRAEEICRDHQAGVTDEATEADDNDGTDEEDEDDAYDPDCYAFQSEDSYPIGQLIAAMRRLANRPDLPADTAANLKVFLFAMERLPLVTPGVRMSLGLRLDQGGESDWIEIRMEDGEFTLGRGTWIDGDSDTETVFEVTPDYRDGDAFVATQFAESFAACASDVCREVVIEDFSDTPFTGWDLAPDRKRWSELPCSFL
jgi:hypothetical protein